MTIGIVGAGNMAAALARGWGDPVLVSDTGSGRARALVDELGGEAFTDNVSLADRVDLLVLAHKPAQLQAVAAPLAGHAKAVVSVLGGVTLAQLREAYPGIPVARTMPNTPVELRKGVTCLADDPEVDVAFHAQVHDLFDRVGAVVRLPERLMDTATGLSGVFPAYVALIAEAQVDAGVRRGLTAAQATDIVAAALLGSAELLVARRGDTLQMRREVASPGGSTARGLNALERAGLRTAFGDALDAVLAG
jgi:pyrroline-5-carboxylate reductase